jgi:hypothetical protein
VDNHAANLLSPPWMLFLRHGYVNPLARLVGKVLDFGGGLVAENRSRPHPEHHSPQSRFPRQISGECCVDTVVQAAPRACAQPPLDGLTGQAGVKRLLP